MNVGDIIEGRYVIEHVLGEGGMARVYRVRHLGLGSLHALKVLNTDLASRPEIRNRFAAEGQIQAQVRHPNIVAVTEIVVQPDLNGLVMDYVEGPPLDSWLAGLSAPPSRDEVHQIFMPVLEAMGHAHLRGIIHRDIKPENILLGRDPKGRFWPRVSDFGIAKVKLEADQLNTATRTGMSMGTRGYMSPEQIKNARDVSARADIFSLGATLYVLATLHEAFDGDSDYEVMDRIVHERFKPPNQIHPAIDPSIAYAITVALRADPASRFSSCEEFAEALLKPPPSDATPKDVTPAQIAELPTAPKRRASPESTSSPVTSPAKPERRTEPDNQAPVPVPEPIPPTPSTSTPSSASTPAHKATGLPVLDPKSFEEVDAKALPEEVDKGVPAPLAPGPLPVDVAQWAFERLREHASSSKWPEPVCEALKLTNGEMCAAHRVKGPLYLERREVRVKDLPFPSVPVGPCTLSTPEQVDPWGLALPPPPDAATAQESFIVSGSVQPRHCAACSGQGNRICIRCEGQGGDKCVRCSGTGKSSCVLCDGVGRIANKTGAGMEKCPRCLGSQYEACASCEGGRVRCKECGGTGARGCSHCGGQGKVAKVLLVVRSVRRVDVADQSVSPVPEKVRGALLGQPEGQRVVTLRSGRARPPGLETRIAELLERAESLAWKSLPEGPHLRPVYRELEVRQQGIYRLHVHAFERPYEAWVVPATSEVIISNAPVDDWRKDQLARVPQIVQAKDTQALQKLASQGALVQGHGAEEAAKQVATKAVEHWKKGELSAARKLRDESPPTVAREVTAVLAPYENSLGRDLIARQARQTLLGLLLGVIPGGALWMVTHAPWEMAVGGGLGFLLLGWVPVQLWQRANSEKAIRGRLPLWLSLLLPSLAVSASVAAAAFAARQADSNQQQPPQKQASCHLKGVWEGGLANQVTLDVPVESDGSITATVKIKETGKPERDSLVHGSCDATTHRFRLTSPSGIFVGSVDVKGEALNAAWQPQGGQGVVPTYPYRRIPPR